MMVDFNPDCGATAKLAIFNREGSGNVSLRVQSDAGLNNPHSFHHEGHEDHEVMISLDILGGYFLAGNKKGCTEMHPFKW
jgi:hypothetical protein